MKGASRLDILPRMQATVIRLLGGPLIRGKKAVDLIQRSADIAGLSGIPDLHRSQMTVLWLGDDLLRVPSPGDADALGMNVSQPVRRDIVEFSNWFYASDAPRREVRMPDRIAMCNEMAPHKRGRYRKWRERFYTLPCMEPYVLASDRCPVAEIQLFCRAILSRVLDDVLRQTWSAVADGGIAIIIFPCHARWPQCLASTLTTVFPGLFFKDANTDHFRPILRGDRASAPTHIVPKVNAAPLGVDDMVNKFTEEHVNWVRRWPFIVGFRRGITEVFEERNTPLRLLFPSAQSDDLVDFYPGAQVPGGAMSLVLRLRRGAVVIMPEPGDLGLLLDRACELLASQREAATVTVQATDRKDSTEEDTEESEQETTVEKNDDATCRHAKEEVERMLGERRARNPLVGDSDALLQIYPEILRAVRDPELNVLIYGETGSGKEVVTELLSHFAKKQGHCVSEDVTAISSNAQMMSSRLFGIKKGMATDVDEQKGLLEKAADGTLALDGMEFATPEIQRSLRRAFDPDYRKYRVVGGSEKPVTCRLVAMYNQRPLRLIKEGKCLPDYWQRFEVKIDIPPLCNRTDDIPALVKALVHKYASRKKVPKHQVNQFRPPPDVVNEWQNRKWRSEDGNVRGLREAVYRFLDKQLGAIADGCSRGGRPRGSRAIPDDVLIELLRQIQEDPAMWTADRVYKQINLRIAGRGNKPMDRTQDALLRRIGRISDDAIRDVWGSSNFQEVKNEMRMTVRRTRGFSMIPQSKVRK